MNHFFRVALLALPTMLAAPVAQAQHDTHEPRAGAALTESSIGTVDFQTSCKPTVREIFNRGVSLLHSFWFAQARAAFEEALRVDPNCAIAHWGVALTHWGNPFGGLRTPETIALGKAATDKGQTSGAPTPRERG